MERILIAAATEIEIAPFLRLPVGQRSNADVAITGVGMVAAAYALGKQLASGHYDLVLNVGIAGSFNRDIPLGEVIFVHTDILSELGAEDGDQFIDSEALGLTSNRFSTTGTACAPFGELRQCTGITVNRVHGDEQAIAEIIERIRPDTESMEGAAVYYAAKQAGIPAAQVRAISNYVERRDKSKWKIPLAIDSLNRWLTNFINQQARIVR